MNSYDSLTDLELIALLKEDDQSALTEIYGRYSENLAGFAASKLHSLDDAMDIIHDLFVKLWEDRNQLTITSKLTVYLFSITRYRVIDKIRKNTMRKEYAMMLQSLHSDYTSNIEQRLAVRDLENCIKNSVNELSPKVKQIYKLSREEGLSIREIAEKLKLSEQTIKNQLSTALSHLRKSLSEISVFLVSLFWVS